MGTLCYKRKTNKPSLPLRSSEGEGRDCVGLSFKLFGFSFAEIKIVLDKKTSRINRILPFIRFRFMDYERSKLMNYQGYLSCAMLS